MWGNKFTDAEPKAIIFGQRLAIFVSNRPATEIVSDFIALAEEILGLTRDPLFPELLQFEELTCNHEASYDSQRSQQIEQRLAQQSSGAGLHTLGGYALERIVEVERSLAKQGLPDVASRLYTGTIAGALIGALYNNRPETVAGTRYREAVLTPPWLLRTGD